MKHLLFPGLLLLSSCSEPKPPAKSIPEYQTLHRTDLKGTFFHFDHQGDLYIACSIHQGGNHRSLCHSSESSKTEAPDQ